MERDASKFRGESARPSRWRRKPFAANVALLVTGFAVAISGLVLQWHYHLRKSPGESAVFTLSRPEWNAIHVWTSVFFCLLLFYHVWVHRKWYRTVMKRNIHVKSRPTVVLTALTFPVVFSGLIPLFILFFDGNPTLRHWIIEVHDKAALLFLILVSGHVIRRFRWYIHAVKGKGLRCEQRKPPCG